MSFVESFGQPAHEQVQPGVYRWYVHPDIEVLETNRLFGNLDVRFEDEANPDQDAQERAVAHQQALGRLAGCEQLKVIVPQISNGFVDIDKPAIFPQEGFKRWPAAYQPTEDVAYDPADETPVISVPTDGLITRRARQAIAMFGADCPGVAIYMPGFLGMSHIGREGARLDIGVDMLRAGTGNQPGKARDARIHFGAAIAAGSYLLTDVKELMRQPAWEAFLRPVAVKGGIAYETDFVGYAINRLIESGVRGENITRTPVDVYGNFDWFSYTATKDPQKQRPEGRNGIVAMIK